MTHWTKLTENLKRLDQDASYCTYAALANTIGTVPAEESPWPVLKVAVLRNFTVEPLLPVLKGEIARMGFFPDFYVGDYDTIASEVMSAQSNLYQFRPDVIILAQWLEGLATRLTQRFVSLSHEEVVVEIGRILTTIAGQLENIRKHSEAPVLMNNFPLLFPAALGILDVQSRTGQINTLRSLNQELLARTKDFSNVFCVD